MKNEVLLQKGSSSFSNYWATSLNDAEIQLKKLCTHNNDNLYVYAANNPVPFVDSNGLEWLCRIVDGVDEIFYKDDIASNHDAKKAYGDSAYVLVDGQQYGAFTFYNNNGNPYMTDPFGNTINQTRPIQGENYDIFPGSATKQGVNPDTLHKNYMGTSYTGPHNPMDYGNPLENIEPKPNFEYRPRNKSEFGSIEHDKAYAEKGAAGVKGALFNRDVVGADYKLAAYNLGNVITPEPITKVDRLRSFVTFEAFMTLGTLKFLFVPQETNDPMMVEGMYARH